MKREKGHLCKWQWVGWFMLATFLTGCAVPSTMRIRSFPDPETALLEYTRFDLKPGDNERPLEEIHILKMVKEILLAKGFVEDTQKPQFHVQVIFGQEQKKKIEPIRTYTTERPVRRIRRSDGTYRYIYGGERTYVEGGGTKRYNARHIRLRFFDAEISAGKPIWEGEAISNGRSDLFTVTPCLLEGLLDEFPHGTGVVVKKFDDRCPQEAAAD
jgi:hypothetical protein